jgi:hypothetical protein
MDDESIGAENRADEITGWLNGLEVRVAVRICRAYTKKKLSSLINANVEDDEESDGANHEQNDENEEENARERSDEDNVSDSLWMGMSQVEFMIRMFCAYARHQFFALAILFVS